MLGKILRFLLPLIMKAGVVKDFSILSSRNPVFRFLSEFIPFKKIVGCGMVIASGIGTGLLGDLFLAGPMFNLKDIYGAILLSPVTIPNATVHLPVRVPNVALLAVGYAFWPLFVWRVVWYLKRASFLNKIVLFLITAVGFFGIIHKFWASA